MQSTPQTTPPANTETLQAYLIELNRAKKELETIQSKLGEMLHDIDETLEKLGTSWAEHREKYCDALVQQLQDRGIVLNDEEKNMLRYAGSTASSVREMRENLEKLKIKVPGKATDFAIVACGVVVAALSRTLQKSEEAYSTIKALKAIDEESDDTDKFKTQCKKQLEEVRKVVAELKNQVAAIHGLSPEQRETIEKIATSAAALQKSAAAAQVEEQKPEQQTG